MLSASAKAAQITPRVAASIPWRYRTLSPSERSIAVFVVISRNATRVVTLTAAARCCHGDWQILHGHVDGRATFHCQVGRIKYVRRNRQHETNGIQVLVVHGVQFSRQNRDQALRVKRGPSLRLLDPRRPAPACRHATADSCPKEMRSPRQGRAPT